MKNNPLSTSQPIPQKDGGRMVNKMVFGNDDPRFRKKYIVCVEDGEHIYQSYMVPRRITYDLEKAIELLETFSYQNPVLIVSYELLSSTKVL